MENSKEEQDKSKKQRSAKERRGKNEQRKNPLEGKANETRSGPIVIEEKSNNGENKDPEKEVVLSDQYEKENTSLVQTDSGVEVVKEGGNQEKSEEESDAEEEEEEEGGIEVATPIKKKARGRKSTKEVREKATYKDKLQGSQLTLEKLL